MQPTIQITFRGMEPSAAVETRARALLEKLQRFASDITTCHVTIHSPHQHHHQGQLYDVHIRIGMAGGEINIGREGSRNHAHEDVYVALRDAFDAAVRKLEDAVRRRDHRARGPHESAIEGKLTRLFPQDGYGFIETEDGLEVYFHENSVLGAGFAKLEVGDLVRLEIAERESEKGPQATSVRKIG